MAIKEFKKNHWYRYTGPKDFNFGNKNIKNFILDGEWHQCNGVNVYSGINFYNYINYYFDFSEIMEHLEERPNSPFKWGDKLICIYNNEIRYYIGEHPLSKASIVISDEHGQTLIGNPNSYSLYKEPEVKELTMEELEEHFGCKVKIVKEDERE